MASYNKNYLNSEGTIYIFNVVCISETAIIVASTNEDSFFLCSV